ncbi:hypothetical protein AVEN_238467-1 [Araneus ventricosus]|uniref:Uncharacterized protein n=1 Tax=Araneus ventricosus TaxID=182803 RepID=A0A4Y2L808_ARAVE|nr:hypothetical protein AVEN_238467-1 [Araneus ventricosus]
MEPIDCQNAVCDYMSCRMTEKLCKFPGAKRIKNAAFCGCCDKCVIVKKKGQQCLAVSGIFEVTDIECEAGTICSVVTFRCE